ncbi:MAG: hypothetical protein MUR36_05390, partial [Paracoccaceae bacterium]|nr:hypothetical protein [Paracoccaceae bacterium]
MAESLKAIISIKIYGSQNRSATTIQIAILIKGLQAPVYCLMSNRLQRGHDLVADLKIGRDTLHV